jgi:dolichol-phosphate mannosyltransferase
VPETPGGPPDIAVILAAPGDPALPVVIGRICAEKNLSAEVFTADPPPLVVPEGVPGSVRLQPYTGQVIPAILQTGAGMILVIDPRDGCAGPALTPLLVALQGGSEVVIAVRAPEFRTRPLLRWLTGKVLFPDIPDPLSGTFGMRRDLLTGVTPDPRAGVPLLEVLGRCRWRRATSVICEGRPSDRGTASLSVILQGMRLLKDALHVRNNLLWEEERRAVKFLTVGISGIAVNMGFLYLLTEFFGIFYGFSSVVAIELSIVNNFLLNDLWTFRGKGCTRFADRRHRFLSFQAVTVGGLIVNLGTLLVLTEWAGIYYLVANLIGILLAFAWNYLVNRNVTWG